MVNIKGLVIRTTPVIPDMKTGEESELVINRSPDTNNHHSLLPLPGLQSCCQRIT